MASFQYKKRKFESSISGKAARPSKISRKQLEYHSSSEDEQVDADSDDLKAVDLAESDEESDESLENKEEDNNEASDASSEGSDDSDSSSEASDSTSNTRTKKRKRNDPEAFATSMSKILGAKLSNSKRADPVLARSKSAALANEEISHQRLEAKARRKLKEDKRAELDTGRIMDILGSGSVAGETGESVGESMEREKKLKKTAMRGVVQMFNAVRAAQIKAEEAAKEAQKSVVGMANREEKVNEMSKDAFLGLISGNKIQNAQE